MKVLKPLSLSVITRAFSARGASHLAVHVLGLVPLRGAPKLFSEQELWQLVPEALGSEPLVEEGIPKSRAEVLLAGRAHPRERPATTCPVRVRLGPIDKRASVIGDRRWEREVPTKPEPFEAMPLTWERAFGGEGFAENPLGVGFAPVPQPGGGTVHRLPNVEHPDRLIRSPKDRPTPVGFGRVDLRWPQRARHRGTYDQRWLETRYPAFADDLDWRHWNLAPEDQQTDGAFVGDEAFLLENLHPEHPRLEGTLPGLVARAFLVRGEVDPRPDNLTRPAGPLEEVETRLMTVWLFPEHERALLIFSGAAEVREEDARDVRLLLLAAERRGAPRPLAHYDAVVDKRCDRDSAAIEALMDADLVPEDLLGPLPTALPGLEPEGLFRANQRRARERRLGEAAELAEQHGTSLEEMGVDFGDEGFDAPDIRELPRLFKEKMEELERMKEDLRARGERKIADARALTERLGIDFTPFDEAQDATPFGPPAFTADGERERMRDIADRAAAAGSPLPHVEAMVEDEAQYAEWKEQERKLRDLYRTAAHQQSPAPRLSAEQSASIRAELEAAARAGTPVRERDLTGVDLARAQLRGIDLGGSLLESASLVGADLEGATLDAVVLAHADLSEARLAGASLVAANLGRARLGGADASGANLDAAVLWHADGSGASFVGARFGGSFLLETQLAGADLSELVATELFWVRVTLDGARLVHADLTKSTFVECALARVDLSDAVLRETNFVTCSLEDGILARVEGPRLRFVHGTNAPRVDLRHAKLPGANLRAADLSAADLSGAVLDGADLSEAMLSEGKLFRARARGAMFLRTDLRGATLMEADLLDAFLTKADVRGADLRGASLFGADLAQIHGDAATQLDGADRERARVYPIRRAT